MISQSLPMARFLPQVFISLSKSKHKSQQVMILKTIKSKMSFHTSFQSLSKDFNPYHSHHQKEKPPTRRKFLVENINALSLQLENMMIKNIQ
uniref:Putative ovule protein n=1 Tax=Solanum chacoense TaxID=4108 RepID=A0A0V0HIV5_SOLCH